MTNQEKAIIEKRFLGFFKAHPEWRCEANRNLLQDYCDKHMLSVAAESGAEALEIAALAMNSRLAVAVKEKEPAPRPQVKQQEDLDQPFIVKNAEGKTHYNEFWTKERLRAAINQDVRVVEQPVPVLSDEYTAKRLKQMSAGELRKLAHDLAFESGLGPGSERLAMIGITNRLQNRN